MMMNDLINTHRQTKLLPPPPPPPSLAGTITRSSCHQMNPDLVLPYYPLKRRNALSISPPSRHFSFNNKTTTSSFINKRWTTRKSTASLLSSLSNSSLSASSSSSSGGSGSGNCSASSSQVLKDTVSSRDECQKYQLEHMEQLVLTAIDELKYLAKKVADAESRVALWEKRWMDLHIKHDHLIALYQLANTSSSLTS